MVGITIGLFIVAAAVTLVAGQLSDNRRLTLELQVQQDLRASADIITRQLRRAGGRDPDGAESSVSTEANPMVGPNPMASASVTTSLPANQVDFYYYYRPGVPERYGFRLNTGVVETWMGTQWQQLTDPRTMRVTQLLIDYPADTGQLPASERLPCPLPCANGTSSCWPTVEPRVLQITIRAVAAGDPSVERELTSRVRLRNDLLRFNDTTNPNRLCPL
jgi:type IV pilus assembly protein PilW